MLSDDQSILRKRAPKRTSGRTGIYKERDSTEACSSVHGKLGQDPWTEVEVEGVHSVPCYGRELKERIARTSSPKVVSDDMPVILQSREVKVYIVAGSDYCCST